MPRLHNPTTTLALAVFYALMVGAAVRAAAPNLPADAGGVDFFEKHVRPVLVQQCYKCHAATSEKLKANLSLDSRQGLLQGGDTGPAVVPGHPEKSLLIEAVKYTNDDMQMPPKNRLPASAVADLVKWVQMGAPWPQEAVAVNAKPAGPAGATANYDRLRHEHWAWQPLHDSPTPGVKDAAWPRNDIDRYVLAKLEAKDLTPVADADKRTLIRRVTLDLTGLPPTPEDVESFAVDSSPDAYARRVDRLIASHAFGERWARHWLDVARYAESTGSSRNVPYNNAWRYRDYVIDAFNQDKPYDRFISEQIAGDLMPARTPAEHNEHLIATGFLAIGVKDLNEKDRVKYLMDNVDEQIDVTTRSIMALTVACARCHDHKFDPIPTTDYYALAGIFRSTELLAGVSKRDKGAKKKGYDAPSMLIQLDPAGQTAPAHAVATADTSGRIKAFEARAQTVRAELQSLRKNGKNADAGSRKTKRSELQLIESQIASLRNATADVSASAGSAAMGVRDADRVGDCAVCLHGEPHDLGPQAPRGFVGVVPVRAVSTIDPTHSGRLELAQWLTGDDNPLTPRVMVNRIWANLFGEGIVRTVDNFGSTGEAPANSELLDHLATEFVRDGWSVKRIVREIVMSRAYQLSSAKNPSDFNADPGDRLVWRMASRRLDAEEIRDAMLFVGGNLDAAPAIGSPAAGLPVVEIRNAGASQTLDAGNKRSVYLPILRDLVPPALDLFDFAEPTMVIGSRDSTTVATQALFLMNDPFVIEQASHLAERVRSATGMDDAGRVDFAYRLALSRSATASEKARTLKYIFDFEHQALSVTKDSLKGSRSDAWASFCQALLAGAEFRYVN
ncbi:MAG TPA: PSD1 and planctomycete cytochrome C domain-containing protein [Tepidisphaeraceae bacterium]|jgi:cytochrome c553|nr:PSD1 and planctomycete cytochrome C domain-containing protein [Tepidisphaeraceae bacterium]